MGYKSSIIDQFLSLATDFAKPDFSLVVSNEISSIDPDLKWSQTELVAAACSESWQKDEINETDHIALKYLFFRLIVPKEHWNDCTFEKFVNLTKQRYMEQISEE